MDKEKLRTMLTELLQDQVKAMMISSDFSTRINEAVQKSVGELQQKLAGDPLAGISSGHQSDSLVHNSISHSYLSGNVMVTPQGSWLDLSRKHMPWIKVSKEVQDWAKDFITYVNSKGKVIGKTLTEADSTQGGLELEMRKAA